MPTGIRKTMSPNITARPTAPIIASDIAVHSPNEPVDGLKHQHERV